MREFIVNENDSGQRTDKFIAKLMPLLPQSMMYKGFRKNCVKLNGKHLKDGKVFLDEGDVLQLYFKDEFFSPEPEFEYIKPQLEVVYEDENILVINKDAGVVVHADEKGTKKTLVAMVQSYLYENNEYNPETEKTFRPSLCNRLDRNTGGLIIAAKNAKALRSMNEGIKNGKVNKYYKAVAEGYTPESGTLNGYLSRNEKVTSVLKTETKDTKQASLDYKTLKQKDGYSLLEIRLYTGRTHQIRSQLSNEGFPLAGDIKYGGHNGKFKNSLWSVKLEFCFDKAKRYFHLVEGFYHTVNSYSMVVDKSAFQLGR